MNKLSVLHIDTEKGWGGGQKQVLYLHRGLFARGVLSVIVCRPNSPLHLRCLDVKLPCKTVRVICEPDLFAAKKIAALAKQKKINCIHAHSAHAHSTALLARLFMRPKPHIIVTRRVAFPIKGRWLDRKKYLAENVSYIAISNAVKETLLTAGVAQQNVRVVPIAIESDETVPLDETHSFLLRREFELAVGDFIIGTVGSLTECKGHANLLKAVSLTKERLPQIKCIIVGDGKLNESLKNLAEKLNIEQKIVFTGFRKDASSIMALFDVFVLPSLSEGFSNVTLEAMALGKSVVASDVGGLKDLVRDRENGVLVPAKNPEKIASAVMELYNNPDFAKQLAQQARHDARNMYTVENMINSSCNYYEKILGNTQ